MEGKAKEAFQAYLIETQYFPRPDMIMVGKLTTCSFTEVQPFIFNAKIIEWLDSVGIYIDIEFFRKNVKDEALFVTGTTDELNGFQPLGVEYHSRQEATEAAIKKAVEIYNSKYKENE